MNRNLDGLYFRGKRSGKLDNVCFSDLTEDEMIYIFLTNRDAEFLRQLVMILGKKLKKIGDEFDIIND